MGCFSHGSSQKGLATSNLAVPEVWKSNPKAWDILDDLRITSGTQNKLTPALVFGSVNSKRKGYSDDFEVSFNSGLLQNSWGLDKSWP